jgi:hypothetical protein
LTGCLFRVAVILSVVILIFFAVTFVVLFVFFFLVWLLSKDEIANDRLIRRIAAMSSAHVEWYARHSYPLASERQSFCGIAKSLQFDHNRHIELQNQRVASDHQSVASLVFGNLEAKV